MLGESLKARLASCAATEKVLIFDRYTEISTNDHERQRRAGICPTKFNLGLSREAVMKNKHNKRGLSRLLSTFNLGCGVSVESRDDSVFLHDEAAITPSAICFKPTMLVVRWSEFSATTATCSCCWFTGRGLTIYMLLCRWISGMVFLDINATCAYLGDTVCSQLLGAHALSGCDTVSYPFDKGKISVLKTLKAGNVPGLFDIDCLFDCQLREVANQK